VPSLVVFGVKELIEKNQSPTVKTDKARIFFKTEPLLALQAGIVRMN
jgi:hypothetical protein